MFQVLADTMMVAARVEPNDLRAPHAPRRGFRRLSCVRRTLDDLFASAGDGEGKGSDRLA